MKAHKLPDYVPVNTVEGLYEINKVQVYLGLPFIGLFDDYPRVGNVLSARLVFLKPAWLRSSCLSRHPSFLSRQIEYLTGDREKHDSSLIVAEP